ncbi:MAG TPA: Ig-like domain repeat protein [Candidatus Acidoferrum sp.]|nr:Ig-like domain repeat protein [Candidatus Acidoferrum sp.]
MLAALRKLPLGCALAMVFSCLAAQSSAQTQPPVVNRVLAAPENSTRVTLNGNVHPKARAEFSRGPAPDALPMNRMLLLLKRSSAQEADLQSWLDSQQDKSSPSYHQWLAPEEFGRRFGPSDADVQSVTDWLAAQGFHDIRVGPGRNIIEFSGLAGQVRQAFATQMQNYLVKGSVYVANSSDPQIPAALAPVVSGIVSLHNFPRRSHSKFVGDARRRPGDNRLQPLFTFPNPYTGENFYGVAPGDFAAIYNSKALIGAGNDGTGQTIAIVGETQIDPTDVSDFRAMFGLANNFSSSNVILNGMNPGVTSQDEESESDLDVQWSGAVAPGATVKLVVSASTPASAGIDLSALYIVEHNLADIMSESYGACETDLGAAGNAFYNALWQQAAAQGITVILSSGDGGSAGCDDFNSPEPATQGLAVSGIASTPFNVSVGGTDFNQINTWSSFWNDTNDAITGTSARGYIPEIPWSDSCAQLGLSGCGPSAPGGSVNIVAASGGQSHLYAKPKWQLGVAGMPNDNHRDQPDISLFSSSGFTGSGYLFCQKDLTGIASCNLNNGGYTFHIIGGTSASAPAFAGVMALVNQYSAAHGGSSRQGNANVTLYALAKKSGASCTSSVSEAVGCIFNDVSGGNSFLASKYGKSVGTNSVPCRGGTPNCSAAGASVVGVLVDPSHTTTEAWTDAAGYDMASGLGTLNVNNLAAQWNSASTIGTATTLSLSPTTGITHGAAENVTVTVSVNPKTGTGIPSGDVALLATLADGSTLGLDQFTLSNGAIANAKTQNLPGGTYKVYAHYAGDGTNAPSDSLPVSVTVAKESSQTFLVIPSFDSQGQPTSGNAKSVQYGSDYIIRMYVASNSAAANAGGPPSGLCESVNPITCPTGSVTLTANGAAVDGGVFLLNNNGYTRDIAPALTGGTYSLLAKYSGDNSYAASTSATDTFTVTPAPSQTSFYSSNFYTLVGQPLGINAFANVSVPGGAAPTGTFSFLEGTNPVTGTITVYPGVSGGFIQAGIGAIFNSVGQHTITAAYSGDANYAPSKTSAPLVVYAQYPATVTITADFTTILYGKSVNITATVVSSHASPAFAGTLSFYSPFNGTMGPVTTTTSTDSSGNQILKSTFVFTPQTSAYINADYGGDTNYSSGSNTVFINVNVPDFSLSLAPSVSFPVGQAGSTQISVQPATSNPTSVALSCAGNLPIGYSCAFSPASVSLANGVSAVSQLTLSPSATGNAIRSSSRKPALLSVMLGNHGPSSLIFTVAICILAALFCWSLRVQPARWPVLSGVAALGVLCAAVGCGGGSSYTPPPGGGGPPAPSATTLTAATSSAKIANQAPVTFTATVAGQGTPTGSVDFYLNGSWYGNGAVTQGMATVTTTISFPGTYTLTANYSGDATHLASSAPGVPQAVTGSTLLQVNAQTGPLVHSTNILVTLQ